MHVVAEARTFDGNFTAIFLFVGLLVALQLMRSCVLTRVACQHDGVLFIAAPSALKGLREKCEINRDLIETA